MPMSSSRNIVLHRKSGFHSTRKRVGFTPQFITTVIQRLSGTKKMHGMKHYQARKREVKYVMEYNSFVEKMIEKKILYIPSY